MRKLTICLALASTAIASPSIAREGTLYLEGQFGPMLLEDYKFDFGTVNDGASVDSKIGSDGAAIVGYDFGPFRVEAEASYRRASSERVTTFGATLPNATAANLVSGTFHQSR